MAKKEDYWGDEEIKLLKKFYPSTLCNEDLLKKFPGRTLSSLTHKASKLKIKRGKYIPKTQTSRKWTQDEIHFVSTFYGKETDKWLQEQLPHRSISSIKKIAFKHRPKNMRKKIFSTNPSWSEQEDTLLLENYESMTTDELAKIIPNRTYDAIRARISVLGLKRDKRYLKRAKNGFFWTDEEVTILKANRTAGTKALQKLLPARSADAIRSMLKRFEMFALV